MRMTFSADCARVHRKRESFRLCGARALFCLVSRHGSALPHEHVEAFSCSLGFVAAIVIVSVGARPIVIRLAVLMQLIR